MEITYLFNSGFLVRTGDLLLVFDDCDDPAGAVQRAAAEGGRLYVFASHAHFDHFDARILAYSGRAERYIFGYDIRHAGRARQFPQERVVYLDAYEEWEDAGIRVASYDSTDTGVSFLVETREGRRIFHAGDFNWWHWEGDTEENRHLAANAFHKQMKRLDGLEADLAFFPVDGRLGGSMDKGAREFVARTRVRALVTMHSVGYPRWRPPRDFFGTRPPLPVWTPAEPGERVAFDGTAFRPIE